MKIKQFIQAGMAGILIGLAISIVFSLLSSANLYQPLALNSPIGQWFSQHAVHGAFIMLYSVLIWFVLGLLFGISSQFFEKNWSPLKATLAHYLTSLLGFLPLSALAGWMPKVPVLSYLLTMASSFTIIYLILWLIFYLLAQKKVKEINQVLGK